MTVLERLKAARELLSDEKKWVKGNYAQDSAGITCTSTDPDAACFCILGACHFDNDKNDSLVRVLWAVLPKSFARYHFLLATDVRYYNDHPTTTHSDILALLDRAIELEEDAQ